MHAKPQMITTYEGYAWERMAFYGARLADRKPQCIGYTHAPIFKLQHSLKRRLSIEYNPDLIMTSGTIQKDQLLRSNTFFKEKLKF